MSLIISLRKIVEGKLTYPSWTTGSVYSIKVKENEEGLLVYYKIKTNKRISRLFPKEINLTTSLLYTLGLLKGEGSNSLGKSNYRRFTITNSNPAIINLILNELDKCSLFKKRDLISNSIHLLHHVEPDSKVIRYWSKELKISKNKFKCFNSEPKTSNFGVCHVYISDVLLRRVIDLVHNELLSYRI